MGISSIDRQRFFLLVSAISAGACPTPVAPKPRVIDGVAPSSAKKIDAPAKPLWTGDSEWWAEPYDPEYCVPAGVGWKPPPICGGVSATCTKSSHPLPCAIAAKDACSQALSDACARALVRLAPEVAPSAVSCLAWGTNMCNGDGQGPEFVAARCMIVATQEACPDPSVDARCAALVSTCKKSWWPLERCSALFSGLSEKGRADVEACVRGSACAFGPAECLALR